METTLRRSLVPALVVSVCVPLPMTFVVGHLAMAFVKWNEPLAAGIGFLCTIGYLVLFFPSVLVFEPLAIGASIWYSTRSAQEFDVSLGGMTACWAAVMVHTAVLVSYLRLGR